ncbi:MAG: alpha/beta fold hydrolase [Solirubrobacteraceae bacterium]
MLVVVLLGCGGDARKEKSRPRAAVTVVGVGGGELVDVGGRRLYVECIGSGSPTVLLEAGLGLDSRSWTTVQLELGRTTRTCAYDRAGLGDSDPMPGVHDAGDEIRDLERLLDRGRIEPPYVLVGHSYGGLLARLFARAHPDQVAGVVFVDAMGRDATRRQLAIWPRSQASAQRREWAKPVHDGVDVKRGEALASSIRTSGDTPVVVITGARTWTSAPDAPPRLLQALDRLWCRLHAELARLSSDRVHVLALRSEHLVMDPDQQPWIVVRAVMAVVRAHRDNARLPPCQRLFSGPDVRCLS